MVNNYSANDLINNLLQPQPWDDEPIYVFTSDMDWASEEVLDTFRNSIPLQELKVTAFVTNHSPIIEKMVKQGEIFRGIHPNFLPGSSQGSNFQEIIETCLQFAPEAIGARAHRLFSVTDVAHLLRFKYGFSYLSNSINSLGINIKPQVHESTLLEFPIFFEDGTFMFQELGSSIQPFEKQFTAPGLKIISFHPMNMVFNTPEIKWMRNIKDSLSREEFNDIDAAFIKQRRNSGSGIYNTVMAIVELAKKRNYKILSLNELYHQVL